MPIKNNFNKRKRDSYDERRRIGFIKAKQEEADEERNQ